MPDWSLGVIRGTLATLRQGKRLTGRLLKLAVSLATRLPFRQAAEIMAEAGMQKGM